MRETTAPETAPEPTLALGFTEHNSETATHLCTGEALPSGTNYTTIQATRAYPADIALLRPCCKRTYTRSTW